MSVRIRLRRMGKKKQPHYRIVVADSRSPRDGRFVENLGYYNPLKHPDGFKVDVDRVDYWLGEGAVPSPTVRSLVSHAREVAARAAQADAGGAEDADTAPAAEDEAKGEADGKDVPDAEAQEAGTADAKGEADRADAPDAEVAPDDDADDPAAETTDAEEDKAAAETDKAAAETDKAAAKADAAAAKDGKASEDEAPDETSAEDASKA